MKVILYYPPVSEGTTALPLYEPLSLLLLARVLRKTEIDVEIIDGRLYKKEALAALLNQKLTTQVVCVGVTSMAGHQFLDGLYFAETAKSIAPDLPVVFGGWYPSLMAEKVLEESSIDIVVRWQGEITFLEVINRLKKKKSLKNVNGISWKDNKTVIHEADRAVTPPEQLPALSPGLFNSLDLSLYQINKVLYYISSLGCSYSCGFCSVRLKTGGRWYPLSAEKVYQEIDCLHKNFGFNEAVFWDSCFFASERRAREICQKLIQKKINIAWSTYARINEIISWDENFLQLLEKSGCRSLFLGAESASQKILDIINKEIKAKDLIPCFKKLAAAKINTVANWIVGIPGEEFSDLRETIKCIRAAGKIYKNSPAKFEIIIYRFVPIPSTGLYSQVEENQRLPLSAGARELAKFISQDLNDALMPWKEKDSRSHYAPLTFYLYNAYMRPGQPKTLAKKVLRLLSLIRIETLFFRFPAEWWCARLWERLQSDLHKRQAKQPKDIQNHHR